MQNGQKIQHFTDLVVWQEAHKLALQIYRETINFPKEETFGLISQIRRSSTSITANIAEGFGRQGAKDKIQFYVISRGSNTELQDQLIMAKDLNFITEESYNRLMEEAILIHKLLNGLIMSIRNA